jgi:hypothetical protein
VVRVTIANFDVIGIAIDIALYRDMREVVEVAQAENAGNTASSPSG